MHTCVCFLCSLLFLLAFIHCCCCYCCFASWFVFFSASFSRFSPSFVLCIYIVDYMVYDMRAVNRGALNTKLEDRTEEKESKKGEKHREKKSVVLLLLFWLLQWRRPTVERSKIVSFFYIRWIFIQNLTDHFWDNQWLFAKPSEFWTISFLVSAFESKCTPLSFTVFFIFAVPLCVRLFIFSCASVCMCMCMCAIVGLRHCYMLLFME